MLNICVNNKPLFALNNKVTSTDIHKHICKGLSLSSSDYYLLQNGKIIQEDTLRDNMNIHIVFKIRGGKGGFGSMLRAIGAQIEKTTNREACRDLSGRRLRDINEEKRLKKWIAQQTEREEEASQRRQKKLERLCEVPPHKFEDADFNKERSQLSQVVETAVSQGIENTATNIHKRKNTNEVAKGKKKLRLWMDAEMDDLSSSDSETPDNEENRKSTSAESSGNNSSDENIQNSVKTTNLSEQENSVQLDDYLVKRENNKDCKIEESACQSEDIKEDDTIIAKH